MGRHHLDTCLSVLSSTFQTTQFTVFRNPLPITVCGPFQHHLLSQLRLGKPPSRLRLRRHYWSWKDKILVVALMGEQEYRFFPYGCCFECVFYCYDCWPSRYDWWQSFFTRYRTRMAFFSAKSAAREFERRCPEMASLWLPEATEPEEYLIGRKLSERTIHVLELGRRYERVHLQIQPSLKSRAYQHLYERAKGKLIFPTKSDLVKGLSESMISLCFPCSMTHPERSGSTETVTHRFFESIASRCLIVGHCPDELIEIFGYNPGVELHPETCVEDIQQIIDNIHQYQDLVDRNYSVLIQRVLGMQESQPCYRFYTPGTVKSLRETFPASAPKYSRDRRRWFEQL